MSAVFTFFLVTYKTAIGYTNTAWYTVCLDWSFLTKQS